MTGRNPAKGMLLIMSGPSGVGKGTLTHMLLEQDSSFTLSCSATTRAPRRDEIDGVHYHFMNDARFDELLEQDAFLEYASVHGHRYGTLRSVVEEIMESGRNVLLEIDQQGARQIMSRAEDYVSVFILPPSLDALRERLSGRGSESREDFEKRIRNAAAEIDTAGEYQYCIVNDDLEQAYCDLSAIVRAEKHRVSRCLPEFHY